MNYFIKNTGFLFVLLTLFCVTSSYAEIQFTPGQVFNTGLRASDIAAGDLNNDGYTDLAVSNIHSPFLTLAFSDADGNFEVVEYPLENNRQHILTIAIGRLDDDDNNDIVIANAQTFSEILGAPNFSDGGVIILYGNGDGTFEQQPHIPIVGVPSKILIEDINGDDRNDILVGNNGEISFSTEYGVYQENQGIFPYLNQGNRLSPERASTGG